MITKKKLIERFEVLEIPKESSWLWNDEKLNKFFEIVYDVSNWWFAFDVDIVNCWEDIYWQATIYVENLRTKEQWNTNYWKWYNIIINNSLESEERSDYDELADIILRLQNHALNMHSLFI